MMRDQLALFLVYAACGAVYVATAYCAYYYWRKDRIRNSFYRSFDAVLAEFGKTTGLKEFMDAVKPDLTPDGEKIYPGVVDLKTAPPPDHWTKHLIVDLEDAPKSLWVPDPNDPADEELDEHALMVINRRLKGMRGYLTRARELCGDEACDEEVITLAKQFRNCDDAMLAIEFHTRLPGYEHLAFDHIGFLRELQRHATNTVMHQKIQDTIELALRDQHIAMMHPPRSSAAAT